MASTHVFQDPTQVVSVALALVGQDLVHAASMTRDYQAEFGGGKGASVNVRVPSVLKARERTLHETAAIQTDDLNESTVAVEIDKHIYSAVALDDADLTLNIEDFSYQVLKPQVDGVVEGIEQRASAAMQALALNATLSNAYAAATPVPTFTSARKVLRDLGVPMNGLYAAVGTQVYADLVNAAALQDASASGSDNALRNAIAGRVSGFNTFESNRLDEDEIVFYHQAAFTIAIRAPKVPDGVAFGRSMADNGFALRWIQDYDSSTLRDRSVVSTFLGVKAMEIAVREEDIPDEISDGVGGFDPNPDYIGPHKRLIVPALRVHLSE